MSDDETQAVSLQDEAQPWIEKGETALDAEKYEEALAAFEQALQLDLASAPAFNGKACALGFQERYEEALAAFEEAIRLAPDTDYYWFNKGDTLGKMERY